MKSSSLCSPAAGEALPLPASLGYIGQAAIALEWDDLDQAASLLDKGAELCRTGGAAQPQFQCLARPGPAGAGQGRFADRSVRRWKKQLRNVLLMTISPRLPSWPRPRSGCTWHAGQIDLAEQCAAGKDYPPASRPGPGLPALVQEVWGVLQARVLLAQERPAEALGLLDPIVAQAKSAGRMARVVEGSLYQAMALYALQRDALEPFSMALAVEPSQGMTRLFLEAGPSSA